MSRLSLRASSSIIPKELSCSVTSTTSKSMAGNEFLSIIGRALPPNVSDHPPPPSRKVALRLTFQVARNFEPKFEMQNLARKNLAETDSKQ